MADRGGGGWAAAAERLRRRVEGVEARLEAMAAHRAEYAEVEGVLESLPGRLNHEVMVPFGPLAFAPGRLVHTNEVLVLLGDNMFVEKTAPRAREVAARRRERVEKGMAEAVAERARLLGTRDAAAAVMAGGGAAPDMGAGEAAMATVEILERIDDDGRVIDGEVRSAKDRFRAFQSRGGGAAEEKAPARASAPAPPPAPAPAPAAPRAAPEEDDVKDEDFDSFWASLGGPEAEAAEAAAGQAAAPGPLAVDTAAAEADAEEDPQPRIQSPSDIYRLMRDARAAAAAAGDKEPRKSVRFAGVPEHKLRQSDATAAERRQQAAPADSMFPNGPEPAPKKPAKAVAPAFSGNIVERPAPAPAAAPAPAPAAAAPRVSRFKAARQQQQPPPPQEAPKRQSLFRSRRQQQ